VPLQRREYPENYYTIITLKYFVQNQIYMYHCKTDRRMLLDSYHANDVANKWGYLLTGRPKKTTTKNFEMSLHETSIMQMLSNHRNMINELGMYLIGPHLI
jgi:hypothetical protein